MLDEAPKRHGFRATAWWSQTRAEIVETIRQSLTALAELSDEFRPIGFEQKFGDDQELTVEAAEGAGVFRLHGVIDRIDKADDGRLRVIDYKTGGPSSFGCAICKRAKSCNCRSTPWPHAMRCTSVNRSTASTGTSNMLSPASSPWRAAPRPPWRVPPSMPGRL